ncbi:hypothetical protein M407DRAFT_182353 [Tulasnella calospora MUT 4182]|uniref:Uncharacterized protein n=1 Tax=Tulasnella calospora MUT 4182 TaxID=1051891 RepID=A0A0C3K5Z9_9AGAM|nr:hypothetical protein M407DRAFT_182353 [Tulasnella calospora MUT 4182]
MVSVPVVIRLPISARSSPAAEHAAVQDTHLPTTTQQFQGLCIYKLRIIREIASPRSLRLSVLAKRVDGLTEGSRRARGSS